MLVIKFLKIVGLPAVKYVLGMVENNRARAASRELGETKLKMARINKETKVELADHEIQVLRTRGRLASWGDEYVIILVSLPIIVGTLGAVVSIGAPETGGRLLAASDKIANLMTGEQIDYPALWGLVVAAALGTKAIVGGKK